jgi:6-phosphogluconolactonase
MRSFSLLLIAMLAVNASADELIRLYIGTGGSNIHASMFDPKTGKLSQPEIMAETNRPGFIWVTPENRSLYSTSETRRATAKDAAIVAWSVDEATGKLTMRNRQDSAGDGPCFVCVNHNRTFAAIANYGSGSIAVYPLKPDGSVNPASGKVQHVGSSVTPNRQSSPHAHSILFDPSGKRVAAADLGTDKVYLYDLGADGSLTPSEPPAMDLDPGAGPRHFVFSPDSRYLLALGELSGTITSYRYAPPNVEKVSVVSTMADDTAADATKASAEILFHPNGKFVYCSNRGPNEIAGFAYDSETGTLKRLFGVSSGGEHPRNFRLSPDGRFLLVANQNSNNIVVYSVDDTSGVIKPTGDKISVPSPMCLKFWITATP